MKKKLMILTILIIVLTGIILIPIITFANKEKKEVVLPVLDEKTIEEENKKAMERLHQEWEKFNAEHPVSNEPRTYTYAKNNTDRTGFEEIDKALEETKKETDKRNEIINKYYADEYAKIKEKFIEESKNSEGIKEFLNSPLSPAEKELYGLVMKIIEKENLSKEESTILREFLKCNKFDIEKDEQLKSRLELILK